MSRFCIKCGSELAEGTTFCSKCNTENNPAVANSKKSNGVAIAGFIVALVSMLLCLGSLSWLSLIISIIGLISAKKLAGEGKGFAIAGIIISVIGLIEIFAFVAFFGIFGKIYDNTRKDFENEFIERSKEFEEKANEQEEEFEEEYNNVYKDIEESQKQLEKDLTEA